MTDTQTDSLWKSLGPGIVFAGAAIGTSHLVQSTRAGASFGLGLLLVVIVANFIKYPAFRFGPQYAAATGTSLVQGYRRLGRGVLGVFVLSELPVMVIILAATATVTAAILLAVTDWALSLPTASIGLIIIGGVVLRVGGYVILERLSKVFVAILTLSTLLATVLALPRIDWSGAQWALPEMDTTTLAFVVALMGFMPSAIDLSVMQSLWSVSHQQRTGQRRTLHATLLDFNIGYIGSVTLAVCFLLMGAGVMYAAGEAPAASAAAFANQVIGLFTSTLGEWAGLIVGVSALLVMFTTLITVLDGFPRMVTTALVILPKPADAEIGDIQSGTLLTVCTVAMAAGAAFVLLYLMGSFRSFIDFVTITAFVVGPIAATLNHLAIMSPQVPDSYRPSRPLQLWSIVGIVAMVALSAVFLSVRFG